MVLCFPDDSGVKKIYLHNAGDEGLIPVSGRSPGEGKATGFSTLAWEILQTEKPGQLRVQGSHKRVNLATKQQQQSMVLLKVVPENDCKPVLATILNKINLQITIVN